MNGYHTLLVFELSNSKHLIEMQVNFIGKENAERRKLTCGKSSKTYCGLYNQSVDPSALNEFSHGAFRQFHSKIPETVNSYNAGKWHLFTVHFCIS